MTMIDVISPVKNKLDTESIITDILEKEKRPIGISELLALTKEIDLMAEFEFQSAIIHLLSKGIVIMDNFRRISISKR